MSLVSRCGALVVGLVAALLIGAVGTAPAQAEDEPAVTAPEEPVAQRPKLMIVGDSISAPSRYSESKIKPWWADVADVLDPARPVAISAQAGSGMVNRGNSSAMPRLTRIDTSSTRCSGTSFGQRLEEIRRVAPDVVIVAGGRNDFKKCVHGVVRRATAKESRAGIKRYMKMLRQTTRRIGIAPADVFVMTPWGTAYDSYRDALTHDIEMYAKAQGFSWIQLPALADRFTSDGTHPTGAGAHKLARLVLSSSTLAERFGATVSRAQPVVVQCAGVSACLGESFVRSRYSGAGRHRYWNQAIGSASNYAAYRLTHNGRRTPRLPGKTAVEWRTGALETGVTLTGSPKVGSLAWWPSDPNRSGDRRGHVAYVEKVFPDRDAVLVSEYRRSTGFRVVKYSGSAFPRSFLAFRTSKGRPAGAVTAVRSNKTRKVTVRGYVSAPGTKGVSLRVRIVRGGKRVTIPVKKKAAGFYFSSTVSSRSMPRGKAKVTVIASAGGKTVSLGSRTVRVR